MSGFLQFFEFDGVALEIAVKSFFILLGACAITWSLRRFSAAIRHFIWFVALANLIALPFLAKVLPPLSSKFVPAWELFASTPGETESSPPVNVWKGVQASTAETPEADGNLERQNSHQEEITASGPRSTPTWRVWVAIVWTAGAVACVAFAVIDVLVIFFLRGASFKAATVDKLPDLQRQLGIAREVELLTGPNIKVPATWGVVKHTVLIPADFHEWDPDRQRVVLCHELAHIKRKDWLTQMVAWIVCSIFWFNPLVWFALRQMRIERERACDDLVLEHGAKPSDYAFHLLEIASSFGSWRSISLATVAMARPTQLEGRLLAILDAKRNRCRLNKAQSMLCVLLVCAFVSPIAASKSNRLGASEFGTARHSLPQGLVSWWPGNGSAKDRTGTNHGTRVANTPYLKGKLGQAFLFYGTGDIVNVGNDPSLHLQNLSIEAWVKRNDPNRVSVGDWGNGHIFGFGLDGYVFLYQKDGTLALNKVGDFRASFSPFKITDTKWHHVAVTKTNINVFFYLDGKQYTGNPFDVQFEFTTDAAIGGRADNLGNSFIGIIDELAVFNRALSSAEVRQIYEISLLRDVDLPRIHGQGAVETKTLQLRTP